MKNHCPELKTVFPWQQIQWNQLQNQQDQNRLPHGLLFSGISGIGKRHFATIFAQHLLCEKKTGCGTCKSCLLFNAGNHPDFILIEPEEDAKQIKIDQIRAVNEKALQTAQQGGNQIILIDPADCMNPNAENALLKTLEEPPKNTFIILITHRLSALLPTIRSRCQIISFSAPSREEAVRWMQTKNISGESANLLLNIANNAPLKALSFYESDFMEIRKQLVESWLEFSRKKIDLVAVSNAWQKLDLNIVLLNFATWISDLIKIKQLEKSAEIINIDHESTLQKMANFCNVQKLHVLLNEINRAKNLITTNSSVNTQLLIEQLLIKWKGVLTISD